jgi:sporulation protein YtfJ
MSEENKLQDMIRTSLESIRAMVDANTVVGTPIQTPAGTTIIPISKVSVGYASGGLDFGSKANAAKKNFGGGGGTGLSVQPVCFLCVNAEGNVEMIPLGGEGEVDTVERIATLIEKTPDILSKVKSLFGRKKRKQAAEEEEDLIEAVADAAAEAVAEQLSDKE